MTRFFLSVFVVVSLCVTFLTGGLGHAKEPVDPHERAIVLEDMVVTASRDWEEVRKAPANVTVITARQIEQSGATTIPELLERQESILFRDYSGNSASTAMIDLRGFGGDNPFGKVLILVDGIRMNPMDMSTFNWMQIPLQNIERIEIVRGAGSVLYGDAAIGGVVHIMTKKGFGKPQFQVGVTGGSYGLHDERFSLSGSEGKLSYAATFENRFAWGYRERSKTDAQGGNINLGYEYSDKLNFTVGAALNNNAYEWPGALTKAQKDADRTKASNPNDDQKDTGMRFVGRMEAKAGAWGALDLAIQYASRERKVNFDSWFQWSNTSDQTLLVTPKYVLERDIFGHGNKLTIGLDYYHQPYKKDFFRSRESSLRNQTADFLRSGYGLYVRDEFHILKSLILSAGYRAENTTIGGSYTDMTAPANSFVYSEKRYTAEAWEGGLTWLLGKKSKIFTKYGTIFRIPFLDEIAAYNGFGAGSFNRNLDAERGTSMELGTLLSLMEDLRIGLTFYRTDMKEEVQWVATGLWTGENR
ncbi:MAG: TonB-dependent receptor, partial [Syntrophales bacterium]|nr:TonB-dependent receptor [Syntrophales bacterium]